MNFQNQSNFRENAAAALSSKGAMADVSQGLVTQKTDGITGAGFKKGAHLE
jgi:hypothetical protein